MINGSLRQTEITWLLFSPNLNFLPENSRCFPASQPHILTPPEARFCPIGSHPSSYSHNPFMNPWYSCNGHSKCPWTSGSHPHYSPRLTLKQASPKSLCPWIGCLGDEWLQAWAAACCLDHPSPPRSRSTAMKIKGRHTVGVSATPQFSHGPQLQLSSFQTESRQSPTVYSEGWL